MSKAALFLCDRTGIMARPWADAGYECYLVDLQHPKGMHKEGNIIRVGADVTEWCPPLRQYEFACGFPPCTDISVSGARWFQSKGLLAFAHSIRVFGSCVRIIEAAMCPGFVENPVSVISSHYRKPDFTFDPCDYGDPYRKKTCLWSFGGWTLPPKTPVEPVAKSPIHYAPPSDGRGDIRSMTPPGFALAVFKHHHTGASR